MRRQDFIANPRHVAPGENSNGFRAVTAAGDVTDSPIPKQCYNWGPNMNGERWAQFPDAASDAPVVVASKVGPSKRPGKGR